MSETYITQQGDMVDAIAARRYGSEHGATEAILEANPGLADRGAVLPAGLTLTMPDLPAAAPTRRATVNLWD